MKNDETKVSFVDCVNNNLNNLKKKEVNSYNNKEGWTIINKKTREMIVSDSTKKLIDKIEKEKYHKITSEMINRWNNYRDEINDLVGDLSPYINYKEEIDNMVKEDIKIDKLIEERLKELEEYDSDSDNERNKNLIY